MNKILLLEDDPLLAKTLIKFLQKNNYLVKWAKNGNEAASFCYDEKYDLYLFDINVPLYNGDDLLNDLRQSSDNTPCILISALIDIDSITKGFKSGADDYIKKPFDPAELLVRIKAKTNDIKNFLTYKNYKYIIDEHKITYENKELNLSSTQTNILCCLIKSYPKSVSYEELFYFLESQTNLALRVNIAKLKQKINIDIINIRGVGYKLA